MKIKAALEFEVDVTTSSETDTNYPIQRVVLVGTKLEAEGRTLEFALVNLQAEMATRLARLK